MTFVGGLGGRMRKAAGKNSGLMHRTSLGAMALTASSALRLGLQFAMLPILARLIGPAEYGLVSLAAPFILLANVIADGGMTYALGRRREVSPELESTVFWLAAGIAGGLALFCCLAAFPMGLILHQPRLPALIVALSPILLMNGLAAVSNARIIRGGRFGVFAAGDVIATIASAGVALLAALHGFGAWSLVAQQLVLWICKLSWVTLKGGAVIRLHWRFDEARDVLKFGVHTVGAVLADFVSRNVDSMIVGGVLGTTALGYYAMAYQVVRVPDMLITGPLYLYIFTAMSRAAHDSSPRAVQDLAIAGLRLASAVLAPLFCGLALTADLAVPVVLGPKWLGAVEPLRYLAVAGFGFCICSLMATTLMALGRSSLQLRMSLILGAATIVVVAISAPFGVSAVSAALALGMAVISALYARRVAADLKMRKRALLAALRPAAYGCGIMALVVLAGRRALTGAPPAVELALMVALGAATYVSVILLVARRRLLGDARAFARAQADQPAAAAGGEIRDPVAGLV